MVQRTETSWHAIPTTNGKPVAWRGEDTNQDTVGFVDRAPINRLCSNRSILDRLGASLVGEVFRLRMERRYDAMSMDILSYVTSLAISKPTPDVVTEMQSHG